MGVPEPAPSAASRRLCGVPKLSPPLRPGHKIESSEGHHALGRVPRSLPERPSPKISDSAQARIDLKDKLADILENEARLEALRRTSLLDSPPEEAFDRLTRAATTVLRVPVALVSLVDSDRHFFKSQCGLSEPLASLRQNPLTHSFCKHAVGSREPLVVTDARADPVFGRDSTATASARATP